MTKRHHRQLAAVFTPKRVFADNRYGVDALDNTRLEILPRYHRDSAADDPWLAPAKSDVYMEGDIRIRACAAHKSLAWAASSRPGNESTDVLTLTVDLRELCEKAKLDPIEADILAVADNGWTQRQIAEWLGIGVATVNRRLHSGRGKLIERIPDLVVLRRQIA